MTPSAEPAGECEYVGNVPVPYCGTHDRPAVTCLDLREKDAENAALKERVEKLEGTLRGLIAHHHDDEWEAECYSFELEARRALEAGK